jgi:LuxR family maltose regulon positive regulatory protein
MSMPPECVAGNDALTRGAWFEARESFEKVLRDREIPEALEGLGLAAWWLDLADTVFDARERAYGLYVARDDHPAAARVAVWLAWDSWAFRGENAVSNGWLQRARRLLEGHPPCSERAWLELRAGSLCLVEGGDCARALALAAEGIEIARKAGDINFEILGRAVLGLALVTSGAVAEGMQSLDEASAAVMAGEVTDLVAIGLSFCYMIGACEQVRDYARATQWCARLKVFSSRWGLRPLFAVCRTQYASICIWRGQWSEADRELRAASIELAASRPAMTGDALVRLAELRRRQGRLDEANSLYDQVHDRGSGALGRGELALDRGDPACAAELAARYLRQAPVQNCTDRVPGLELLVRAFVGLGDLEGARSALAELSGIAAQLGTDPMRAAAAFATGCLTLADQRPDPARRAFEDAIDLYLQSGAPFEVARSRLGLARALGELGRFPAAIEESERAIALFSELEASLEVTRARGVQQALVFASEIDRDQPPSSSPGTCILSRREIEVLRLVAQGFNNEDIAGRLFLSGHTIHRHVANILGKLQVSTRAAAVARASRLGVLN